MTQASVETEQSPYHVITPPRGWLPLNLRELWQYRDMVYRMVMRDIKSRYKQSALGPFWIIVMPLFNSALAALVLGGVAGLDSGKTAGGTEMPYFLFMFIGSAMVWNTFTRAFGSTSSCLRSQMGMLTKVYYPRLIAPLTGIAGGLLDLMLQSVVLVALLIGFGIMPPLAGLLTLPLFIVGIWIIALGWGLWISALSIRFRDIGKATGFITQTLNMATPIIWPARYLFDDKGNNIPAAYQPWIEGLFQLNPLYQVVEGFRWATTGYAEWHCNIYTLISAAIMLAFLISGMYVFRRVDATVADYI
jgi:lipopolysaccharide transport system permease protein